MKNRNPIAVAVLSFVTLGVYSIYWQVVTKVEMNERGTAIPTAWLLIVPFVNIWWLWKYSEGVEKVTSAKLSGVLSFVLLWLLGPIGQAVVQDSFNNVPATTSVSAAPTAPSAPSVDPNPVTPPAIPPATPTPTA